MSGNEPFIAEFANSGGIFVQHFSSVLLARVTQIIRASLLGARCLSVFAESGNAGMYGAEDSERDIQRRQDGGE